MYTLTPDINYREEAIKEILTGQNGWEYSFFDKDSKEVVFSRTIEDRGHYHLNQGFRVSLMGLIDAAAKLYLQYNDEDAINLLLGNKNE